jgi:hypothetical protein
MKRLMVIKIFGVFILFLFLNLCTITKRVYNKGWQVEWKQNANRQAKNELKQIETLTLKMLKEREDFLFYSVSL